MIHLEAAKSRFNTAKSRFNAAKRHFTTAKRHFTTAKIRFEAAKIHLEATKIRVKLSICQFEPATQKAAPNMLKFSLIKNKPVHNQTFFSKINSFS